MTQFQNVPLQWRTLDLEHECVSRKTCTNSDMIQISADVSVAGGDGGHSGSCSARLRPGRASDGRTLFIVASSSIGLTLHCVGVPLKSVPGTTIE